MQLPDAGCDDSQAQGGQVSSAGRRNQRGTVQQTLQRIDVPKFLKQLDDLFRAGRIKVGRGYSGRVY
jgi:hypothetical protein